ncbi:hypothetical protein Drorol1_Dr00014076 [Drosera rotundifolia]
MSSFNLIKEKYIPLHLLLLCHRLGSIVAAATPLLSSSTPPITPSSHPPTLATSPPPLHRRQPPPNIQLDFSFPNIQIHNDTNQFHSPIRKRNQHHTRSTAAIEISYIAKS